MTPLPDPCRARATRRIARAVRIREVGLALILMAALMGCAPKSTRPPPPSGWDITPGQSPRVPPSASQHTVFLQGGVRYPKILWSEGLTLSRAILTAQYTDRREPRRIVVVRQGEPYEIDPASLLSGQQDPLIEPGDLIQLIP